MENVSPDQILPPYQLYLSLIESLTPDQVTWCFQHQLNGLKKCVKEGENPDPVPNPTYHRYHKYYEWYYWREFTQFILEKYPEASKNAENFRFYAMLVFVRVAHQYLQFLHVL